MEEWLKQAKGRWLELTGYALQYLMFGHRIALMEVFSGTVYVSAGVKSIQHIKPESLDEAWRLTVGDTGKYWNLAHLGKRRQLRELI